MKFVKRAGDEALGSCTGVIFIVTVSSQGQVQKAEHSSRGECKADTSGNTCTSCFCWSHEIIRGASPRQERTEECLSHTCLSNARLLICANALFFFFFVRTENTV